MANLRELAEGIFAKAGIQIEASSFDRVPHLLTEVTKVTKFGTLWHYTNKGGLEGILNSGKLWATEIKRLSDTTEFQHGLDQLESIITSPRGKYVSPKIIQLFLDGVKIMRDYPVNIYVACFTHMSNSP